MSFHGVVVLLSSRGLSSTHAASPLLTRPSWTLTPPGSGWTYNTASISWSCVIYVSCRILIIQFFQKYNGLSTSWSFFSWLLQVLSSGNISLL
jgi:hypothetical protein